MSWASLRLADLVDDETPNYRETKALVREAIRETIEEAARRVRYTGAMQNESCAKAVEAMLAESQEGGEP